MLVLTVVVLVITAVFLTSKLWLPDDRRMMSSDKVVLQNRTFTKISERYDNEMLEVRLSTNKVTTKFEQTPVLEKYNEMVVSINNKKNKAQFTTLYNELLETDELLIQVPYKNFIKKNESLYYVEISFASGLTIRSDYRNMEYVERIKVKDEAYSMCVSKEIKYDTTLAEYSKLDVTKAIDDTQRAAIEAAAIEQKKALDKLEKELAVCSEKYGD
jgi:hypothetical protein